jgi:hypothetical protein
VIIVNERSALCCCCREVLPSYDFALRNHLRVVLLWDIAFMQFYCAISPSCDSMYMSYLNTLAILLCEGSFGKRTVAWFLVFCTCKYFAIRPKKHHPRLRLFGWRRWLHTVLECCLRAITSHPFSIFCNKFVRQCPTWLCAIAPSSAALNIGTQIQWDCDDTPFKLLCWSTNF